MDPVHTEAHGNYIIAVGYDDCPQNPREWDSIFTLVARKHRHYVLGDKQVDSLGEFMEDLEGKENLLIFPWYMYDHGNVAFSIEPFSCRFDSALAGIAYCKISDLQEYSFKDKELTEKQKALKILKGELEVYQQYANGECYAFTIEERYIDERGNTQYEWVESLGGFYSVEEAVESALEALDYRVAQDNKKKAEEVTITEDHEKLHALALDIFHTIIDFLQDNHKIRINEDDFKYLDDSVRDHALDICEMIEPKIKEYKCSL